jgi:hypothetical protein
MLVQVILIVLFSFDIKIKDYFMFISSLFIKKYVGYKDNHTKETFPGLYNYFLDI